MGKINKQQVKILKAHISRHADAHADLTWAGSFEGDERAEVEDEAVEAEKSLNDYIVTITE